MNQGRDDGRAAFGALRAVTGRAREGARPLDQPWRGRRKHRGAFTNSPDARPLFGVAVPVASRENLRRRAETRLGPCDISSEGNARPKRGRRPVGANGDDGGFVIGPSWGQVCSRSSGESQRARRADPHGPAGNGQCKNLPGAPKIGRG